MGVTSQSLVVSRSDRHWPGSANRASRQDPSCYNRRRSRLTQILRSAQISRRLARGARLTHILDLLGEDGQLNVYAGQLEVRPPGAPTSAPDRYRKSVV